MAETEDLAKEHTAALIFLLENLGFIINHPKSGLKPLREIGFLGLIVNSIKMEVKMLSVSMIMSGFLERRLCPFHLVRCSCHHPTLPLLGKLGGQGLSSPSPQGLVGLPDGYHSASPTSETIVLPGMIPFPESFWHLVECD